MSSIQVFLYECFALVGFLVCTGSMVLSVLATLAVCYGVPGRVQRFVRELSGHAPQPADVEASEAKPADAPPPTAGSRRVPADLM